MTAVGLQIISPTNGAAFSGSPSVSFQGQASLPEELSGTALFYRWYSSLFNSAENRYSLNIAALNDPSTLVTFAMGVGSHAITLAANDQPGETQADQNATQHGGVAGGAPACVIHVFKANLLAPVNGALVSRAAVTLDAEAPLKWAGSATGAAPYTPDANYHAINRLRYRWTFNPVGPPAGRPPVILTPTVQQMVFIPNPAPPRLRFTTTLSAAVIGSYSLLLTVEDNDPSQNIGSHQVAINITVTV
jgi:hypothetical protein